MTPENAPHPRSLGNETLNCPKNTFTKKGKEGGRERREKVIREQEFLKARFPRKSGRDRTSRLGCGGFSAVQPGTCHWCLGRGQRSRGGSLLRQMGGVEIKSIPPLPSRVPQPRTGHPPLRTLRSSWGDPGVPPSLPPPPSPASWTFRLSPTVTRGPSWGVFLCACSVQLQ